MCGIAGIVDLRLEQAVKQGTLQQMTATLEHRGPDEFGFHVETGLGLGSRRLSIVGIADSQQPVYNERESVVVVFNGELFDYVETRAVLAGRGHQLRSSGDTETLVHLWEDHGERMFPHVNGQFAFALFDRRQRTLVLARDRVGICPLHWARAGNWLIFGSEIKALLASGMIPVEADPKGLNHIFTFFCMPGKRTAFRNVWAVPPGCYLKIQFGDRGDVADMQLRRYWDFTFPEQGSEYLPDDESELMEQLDDTLRRAIEIRMRADVPVAAYLSGGVDSATIVAVSRELGCPPVTTFTAGVDDRRLSETRSAAQIAGTVGYEQQQVFCGADLLSDVFPQVVEAADCPVVDPNAGSLWALSRAVREAGLKVVLTGEGADEALAGYVWFKVHNLFRKVGWGEFRPIFNGIGPVFWLKYPCAPWGEFERINRAIGGPHAQSLVYHMTSGVRWKYLSPETDAALDGHQPYNDLDLDPEEIRRWHPLNQSLYFGYKTHLAGLLLNHRGDRAAMANSVEARYPFLDENVMRFCASIHPRWKLRGIRRDKYILRRIASQYLPAEFAMRPKAMFRAPFAGTFFPTSQPYVRQLLSPESIRATPYFDAKRVGRLVQRFQGPRPFRLPTEIFEEMTLTAILGTQLWHHLYLGGGLCELPTWSAPQVPKTVTLPIFTTSGLGHDR